MAKKKPIKTILISGGAGMLGTNIALECLVRGYEPYIMDNLSRPGSEINAFKLESLGVKVLRVDVRNLDDMILDTSISAIIHLAGNVGINMSLAMPMYDFTQNAVSTLNMLELAQRMDVPLIFASTNKVYGDAVNSIKCIEGLSRYGWDGVKAINERFPIGSKHHTPYGLSKLTGDMYCQEYFTSFGVKTVVNRMSCIYGMYQNGHVDQGWIDHFIRTNLAGNTLTIFGDGKQVRDVLYAEDVAKLYLDELENIDKVKGEVFNIGGGTQNTLSLIECMRLIEKETDTHFEVEYKDFRPADQKIYISDITKVKTLLGWEPTTSPDVGIAKMVKAYKNGTN